MNLIIRGSEIRNHKKIMEDLFRIRYENFIVRRGWSLPSRNGLEIDQYDNDDAVYFMALDNHDAILCSARITQTVNNSLLADLFPELIETGEQARGPHIFEGTRFTLSLKLSSRSAIRHVRADLGAEIVNWIRHQGGTQLHAVVDMSAFSAFIAMSLRTRPLGLPKDYGGGPQAPGGGRCIAFSWELTDELLDDFRHYAEPAEAGASAALQDAIH